MNYTIMMDMGDGWFPVTVISKNTEVVEITGQSFEERWKFDKPTAEKVLGMIHDGKVTGCSSKEHYKIFEYREAE